MNWITQQPIWFLLTCALGLCGAVALGMWAGRLLLEDRRADAAPEPVSWRRYVDIEPEDMTAAELQSWLDSGVYATPEWVDPYRRGTLALAAR